jgi:hypothetical protein
MLNREVFLKDPTTHTIPNLGVAKVSEPQTPEQWAVLRYELSSFVCDGEYRRGLERVLDTYLANLRQPQQPAAWISGFYGSGKSHLVEVLRCLWVDTAFPDGARARGLANLPSDIAAQLAELTTEGRRAGGLWAAAGTLGAGAGDNVRLAVLSVLFRSAGLPAQYAPAQLVIWLHQNGWLDAVRAAVEAAGRDLAREINNMHVSTALAGALASVIPGWPSVPAEVLKQLREQFPARPEITDDDFLRTVEDVLALQSTTPGKLPCTVLVFDELQQFIGDDSQRTLGVQNVVEACSSRFGSQLLVVATGQSALQATPQLSKLQGRFTVRINLSDTDVEKVVREVVLRKAEPRRPALEAVLDGARGEIDRHLVGTLSPDGRR